MFVKVKVSQSSNLVTYRSLCQKSSLFEMLDLPFELVLSGEFFDISEQSRPGNASQGVAEFGSDLEVKAMVSNCSIDLLSRVQ